MVDQLYTENLQLRAELKTLTESHANLIMVLNNRGVSYHFSNHYDSKEDLTLFDSCDLYPCLDDRRVLAEARKL